MQILTAGKAVLAVGPWLPLLGVLLVATFAGAQDDAARRPNVLFLLADDLQWDAVGALGNDRIHTPNLDRLAARGMTFTRVYNQGSEHGAVCMPSRAMLLTGRHLWRRGGDGCGEHPLWGETFGAVGYRTFVTGKWHNGEAALARAFDEIGPTAGGMLHSTPQDGDAYGRGAEPGSWRPDDATRAGHWLEVDGAIVHSSTAWANAAIEQLEHHASQDDGRPFFMHVAFHAPHDPRQAPEHFVQMYPPDEQVLPPNYLPAHPFDQGALRLRDELLAPFPRTPGAVRRHMAEYAAIVSHLDGEVGAILDELGRLGLADDTLVLFTGDHGLAVGQHGLLGKQSLYEHSARVALIIAGPGIPAGRRCDALVYLHALFPTTCELAGVPVPPSVDAPSLAPLLRGETDALHDTLYAAYADTQRMLRDERFKLIVYPQVKQVQLFDLDADPFETTNLAGDPEHADTLRRLAAELVVWMDRTEDPLPRDAVAAPWKWTVTEVVRR